MLALFINLVSLTTIKKAFTNRCIYGFWSNWQKNLERNLSRLVQYSTVLLLMCLSHRNHDQKKGNPHCLYLVPTARAPVYSAAFWLLNDRIVKSYKMCTRFLWHMNGLATFSKLFLSLLAKKICSNDCNNQFIVIRNLVSWRI